MSKTERSNKKSSARSTIRQTLLDQILSGALGPGVRLSPTEIASSVGASPTPHREALIELARDGFLENHTGRGFVVRHLSATEVAELYPMIWTLEGLAVRTGPPGAQVIADLVRINAQLRQATDPTAMVDIDTAWHEKLVSECHNGALIETLGLLRRRAFRYESAYARFSGQMPQSARQHATIISLLRTGRIAAAIAELERNWRIGPEYLIPWLERITPSGTRVSPAFSPRSVSKIARPRRASRSLERDASSEIGSLRWLLK